jgi:hypothetical protein
MLEVNGKRVEAGNTHSGQFLGSAVIFTSLPEGEGADMEVATKGFLGVIKTSHSRLVPGDSMSLDNGNVLVGI